MSAPTLDIAAEVLEALAPELPTLDALTEDQAAGRACVWDAERLTLQSAVDLGERRTEDGRWFPRACRKCTAHRAHRAMLDHGSQCPQCATSEDCTILRGLYRLQRECRR
ncbi:hypothetical protein ACH47Z_18215 [Streptomyces sp. NPDC020192]|uniref:hypothetical protein n=1 Tax=Streptomyces sp. NPDC020192 TaxID=3365066 RepID=UPI00379CE5AB